MTETQLVLPPFIENRNGAYFNTKSHRWVGEYKIKEVCEKYWSEAETSPTIDQGNGTLVYKKNFVAPEPEVFIIPEAIIHEEEVEEPIKDLPPFMFAMPDGVWYKNMLEGNFIHKDDMPSVVERFWKNRIKPKRDKGSIWNDDLTQEVIDGWVAELADILSGAALKRLADEASVVVKEKKAVKKMSEEKKKECSDGPDLSLAPVDVPAASDMVESVEKIESEPIADADIFMELDMVVGSTLAAEQEYWPLIKSKVVKNEDCDYVTKEKFLAMVAYAIHRHYPFNDRVDFIAKFCNRTIDEIKNHIAFRYKYYNWYVNYDADIGGTDYEIECEIEKYFAKFYELKDDTEF